MTRPVPLLRASQALTLAIVALAVAEPAAAQPPFPGLSFAADGFIDNDDDGQVSCGDYVIWKARIGTAQGAPFPVLEGEFGATMLANSRIVIGSVEAASEHPAGGPVVVTEGNTPGDVNVHVDLGTVCPPDTCPPPGGLLDGATVTFQVEILRPNFGTQLTVPAFARGSNYLQRSIQASIGYEPCEPPTGPGQVDLFVDKDDGGIVAPAGSLVAYQLLYGNDGSRGSTGVVLTDTVPDHASFDAAGSSAGWSCADGAPPGTACTRAVGPLPAHSLTSAVFAVRLVATLPAGVDQTTNTATITDDGNNGPDDNLADNTSTDTTPIAAAPDLVVGKSDGGATASPNAFVAYALDFSNQGSQGATGVVLADVVPDHASFDAAGSSPGWSCAHGAPAGTLCTLAVGPLGVGSGGSATFSVRVAPALPPGVGEIVNTVTVADDGANGPDPSPANNTATDTTPIEGAAPDLFVVKDDGGATAGPGATILYAVSYGNAGSRGASGVELTDTVPDHTVFDGPGSSPRWSCVDGDPPGTVCTVDVDSLAPGDAASVPFALRVAAVLPPGVDEIVNTAAITDDGTNGPDLDPTDNVSTDTTPVAAAPDLAVVKDDGGVSVERGATVAYALAYLNSGTQGATGVVLSDQVPAHSVFDGGASSPGWSCADGAPPGTVCTLAVGTLAVGEGGSATFAALVASAVPPGVTEVSNTVTISDDGTNGPDLDPGDNASTDTTPLLPPPPGSPALDAFKSDLPDHLPAEPGDAITYTVVISSLGEGTAEEAEFESGAPAHTSLVSGTVSTTHGTVAEGNSPGDTGVRVLLGDLEPADEAVVTFQVAIDQDLPPGLDEIVCQGTVGADGLAPVPTDDPDTPELDDPTRTPLAGGGTPVPVDIPAAGPLGLLGLALVLGLLALRRLRAAGTWPATSVPGSGRRPRPARSPVH